MLENPRLPRRQAQEAAEAHQYAFPETLHLSSAATTTLLVSSLNSPTKTAPKERRYMTPDSHASA